MSTKHMSSDEQKLPQDFYKYFESIELYESNPVYNSKTTGKPLEFLEGLEKVNVFVGPNNTGKSRFLRNILVNQQDITISKEDVVVLNKLLNDYSDFFNNINKPDIITYDSKTVRPLTLINEIDIRSQIEWYNNLRKTLSDGKLAETHNKLSGHRNLFKSLKHDSTFNVRQSMTFSPMAFESEKEAIQKYFLSNAGELFNFVDQLLAKLPKPKYCKLTKLYVPNVRTLRNYSPTIDLANLVNQKDHSSFTDHIRSTYKLNDDIKVEDGQNLFIDLFQRRNSTNENLDQLKKYCTFLSEMFFNGESVEIITHLEHGNYQVKVKIGSEEERLIYHLGDGVQQVILMTFPLFFYERGFMVIEEPEMWLHPGLQRKLIEVFHDKKLADKYGYCSDFIYFIATHSNHILDATYQAENGAVFSVQKDEDKLIVDKKDYGDITTLESLGINNTSVFLANCAIWVEGSTDKLYFSKYLKEAISFLGECESDNNLIKKEQKTIQPDLLKIYKTIGNGNKLTEGTHYTFAFSAGNSIFNLDFSDKAKYESEQKKVITKFLTNKFLVITDNDKGKNPELKKTLEDELKSNFYELSVNEVENLLSPEVIMESIVDRRVFNKVSKENRLKFQEVIEKNRKELKKTKLGSFLDNLFTKEEKKELGLGIYDFADKSGTIKDKEKLSSNAVGKIKWENMTLESKQLAIEILNFIIKNNNF